MRCFEQTEGESAIRECDGAQLIDGKWYMPLYGCDTIQHFLDSVRAAQSAEVRPATAQQAKERHAHN